MKSPSLNELVVLRHHGRDTATGALLADVVIDVLANSMKGAREAAEQIGAAAAAIMADGTSTAEANAVKLKNTALAIAAKATKGMDEARARTLAEMKKIDSAMVVDPPKEAPEIRALVARLSGKEKATALSDDYIASACLAAHPLLSGMTPTEHAMLMSRFQRERYSSEIARKDRLGKALSDLERGGTVLVNYATALTQNPSVTMAEAAAKRAEEAVTAATAA